MPTDWGRSYVDILDYVELHITEKSNKESTKGPLKREYIFIGNTEKESIGQLQQNKEDYLQRYLSKFDYKLNRRYSGEQLLERVVIANIA